MNFVLAKWVDPEDFLVLNAYSPLQHALAAPKTVWRTELPHFFTCFLPGDPSCLWPNIHSSTASLSGTDSLPAGAALVSPQRPGVFPRQQEIVPFSPTEIVHDLGKEHDQRSDALSAQSMIDVWCDCEEDDHVSVVRGGIVWGSCGKERVGIFMLGSYLFVT